MTSPSLNSTVILRDGEGTGTKAGHSLISGSVIWRWASPSGAPARCCRSSPAPPWAWPTNQSRPRQERLQREPNKQEPLCCWVFPLLIIWSLNCLCITTNSPKILARCALNRIFSPLFTAFSQNWCCTGPSTCLEEDKKRGGLWGRTEWVSILNFK